MIGKPHKRLCHHITMGAFELAQNLWLAACKHILLGRWKASSRPGVSAKPDTIIQLTALGVKRFPDRYRNQFFRV